MNRSTDFFASVCVSDCLTASDYLTSLSTNLSPPRMLTSLPTLTLLLDRTFPYFLPKNGQNFPSLLFLIFTYKGFKSESRFPCTRTLRTLYCGRPTLTWTNHFSLSLYFLFLLSPSQPQLGPNPCLFYSFSLRRWEGICVEMESFSTLFIGSTSPPFSKEEVIKLVFSSSKYLLNIFIESYQIDFFFFLISSSKYLDIFSLQISFAILIQNNKLGLVGFLATTSMRLYL